MCKYDEHIYVWLGLLTDDKGVCLSPIQTDFVNVSFASKITVSIPTQSAFVTSINSIPGISLTFILVILLMSISMTLLQDNTKD